jgi:hypothetical protein
VSLPDIDDTLAAQYEALTTGAGWCELRGRTQIELVGHDRARFLNNFCTNDILRLRPGEGCESFFTNVQGKTIGLAHIFCRADSLMIETVPDQAQFLIGHLNRYLIREDVQLVDRSGEFSQRLLSGQAAQGRLSRLGVPVPKRLFDHLDVELDGNRVSLRRVDITGPTCFLACCQGTSLQGVTAVLERAGFAPCGAAAMEAARIEAGTPLFGRDVTDKNLPQEVGRDQRAISFTKGCYLGQETVARIDALGHVNRKLVGVRFVEKKAKIPSTGTPLRAADKLVGHVTSAAFSPALGSVLALAYVRVPHDCIGTHLDSDQGDAEVVSVPVRPAAK